MKTRIFTIAAAAAALLTVSCAKENPVTEQETAGASSTLSVNEDQNFIFNFNVTSNDDTKGGKSAWEAGDQLLGFFKNDLTLGHQLRITYDGTKWNGAFDDDEFAASFKAGDAGDFYLMSAECNISLTNGDFGYLVMNNYPGGNVLSDKTTYTVTDGGAGKLYFCSSIEMARFTTWSIVLTGLDDEDPSHWTLEAAFPNAKTEKGSWTGAEFHNYGKTFFDGDRIGHFSNYAAVPAYTDGDFKVCFAGYLQLFDGDVVLIAKNSSTGKTYFRIIQQNSIKNLEKKYVKLNIGTFTEKNDKNSYLYDTQGNFYRSYKVNDTITIMCDNLRYIPSGIEISDNPASTTAHMWYPYNISGGAASASKDTTDIFKYGYFYEYDAIWGESYSTAAAAGLHEGQKGICPTGWHVPTRNQLLAICGNSTKCSYYGESTAQQWTNAAEYDSGYTAARITSMNAKGYNILPTGVLLTSIYNKTSLDATKCSITEFIGRPAVTYWWTSTPNSNTNVMGWMTTFNGTVNDGKLSLSYQVVKNNTSANYAAALRCVKDIK